MAREVEMALIAEILVGEDQHGIFGEGGADGGEIFSAERLAEIDIAHFGGEIGVIGWTVTVMVSSRSCVCRDWTTERPRPANTFVIRSAEKSMMRFLALFGALLPSFSGAHAVDRKDSATTASGASGPTPPSSARPRRRSS